MYLQVTSNLYHLFEYVLGNHIKIHFSHDLCLEGFLMSNKVESTVVSRVQSGKGYFSCVTYDRESLFLWLCDDLISMKDQHS